MDGQRVKRLFFGQVKGGALQLGVIESSDGGFLAGRFQDGRLVPSDQRQTYIDAFNTAAAAATATSRLFGRMGNVASSRFYEAKAKALRDQMD